MDGATARMILGKGRLPELAFVTASFRADWVGVWGARASLSLLRRSSAAVGGRRCQSRLGLKVAFTPSRIESKPLAPDRVDGVCDRLEPWMPHPRVVGYTYLFTLGGI